MNISIFASPIIDAGYATQQRVNLLLHFIAVVNLRSVSTTLN